MVPDRHVVTIIHRWEHEYYLSFGSMTFDLERSQQEYVLIYQYLQNGARYTPNYYYFVYRHLGTRF